MSNSFGYLFLLSSFVTSIFGASPPDICCLHHEEPPMIEEDCVLWYTGCADCVVENGIIVDERDECGPTNNGFRDDCCAFPYDYCNGYWGLPDGSSVRNEPWGDAETPFCKEYKTNELAEEFEQALGNFRECDIPCYTYRIKESGNYWVFAACGGAAYADVSVENGVATELYAGCFNPNATNADRLNFGWSSTLEETFEHFLRNIGWTIADSRMTADGEASFTCPDDDDSFDGDNWEDYLTLSFFFDESDWEDDEYQNVVIDFQIVECPSDVQSPTSTTPPTSSSTECEDLSGYDLYTSLGDVGGECSHGLSFRECHNNCSDDSECIAFDYWESDDESCCLWDEPLGGLDSWEGMCTYVSYGNSRGCDEVEGFDVYNELGREGGSCYRSRFSSCRDDCLNDRSCFAFDYIRGSCCVWDEQINDVQLWPAMCTYVPSGTEIDIM